MADDFPVEVDHVFVSTAVGAPPDASTQGRRERQGRRADLRPVLPLVLLW